jgi:putative transcriptional regulator
VNVYDSIIKGLNEAVQYEKGELSKVKVDRRTVAPLPRYRGKEIRTIRLKQKMTQQTFAYALGVNKKTVEAWEAGRNVPNGPAQRMLQLMHKDEGLLEKYAIMKNENN